MFGLLNLVKDLVGDLGSLALVRDEGLVDIKGILVQDKWRSPSLVGSRHRIRGFHSDQEAALEIENGIDVEEDLVKNVSWNRTLLFQRLFEIVQVFEILNVFSLRIDQLSNNVISVGHLRSGCRTTCNFIFGVGLNLEEGAALFGTVEDIINDLGHLDRVNKARGAETEPGQAQLSLTHLDKTTSIITHQVSNHKAVG